MSESPVGQEFEMRDFDETVASESVDPEEYAGGDTIWLSPRDAIGQVYVVLSCNMVEKTQYGPKAFAHVVLEGDPDAVEYTMSFGPKSAAYNQLAAMLPEDFPFRCTVDMVGRTFKLASARTAAVPFEEKVTPKRPTQRTQGGR